MVFPFCVLYMTFVYVKNRPERVVFRQNLNQSLRFPYNFRSGTGCLEGEGGVRSYFILLAAVPSVLHGGGMYS